MKDLFDATVLCDKCAARMEKTEIEQSGFQLRALRCPQCNELVMHPLDMDKVAKFNELRGKNYIVKLRIIGNSHAISIPKEIVEFIHEHERAFDDMVKLCFDDMKRLTLQFGGFNERFD